MFGVILAHLCVCSSCPGYVCSSELHSGNGGWRRSPVVIATIASIAAIAGRLALGAW